MTGRHRAACPACRLTAHRFERFEMIFSMIFNGLFRTIERVATIGV